MSGGRTWPAAVKAAAVDRLIAGETGAEVARDLDTTASVVWTWGRLAGYRRGRRGPPRHPRAAEAIRRVEAGEVARRVAADLGVAGATLSRWRRKGPPRPRPRRRRESPGLVRLKVESLAELREVVDLLGAKGYAQGAAATRASWTLCKLGDAIAIGWVEAP